ncbi:unnamed protein product [Heterobilharzia americana]|nr:unnamed protein product [Heterobilharzia americana]
MSPSANLLSRCFRLINIILLTTVSVIAAILTVCIINNLVNIYTYRRTIHSPGRLIYEEIGSILNTQSVYLIQLNLTNHRNQQLLIRLIPLEGDPDVYIVGFDTIQQWITENNLTWDQSYIHMNKTETFTRLVDSSIVAQSVSNGIEEIYIPDEFTITDNTTTKIPLLLVVHAIPNPSAQCTFSIQIYELKSTMTSYLKAEIDANINTLTYEQLTIKLNTIDETFYQYHYHNNQHNHQFVCDEELLSRKEQSSIESENKRKFFTLTIENYAYLGIELFSFIFDIILEILLNLL